MINYIQIDQREAGVVITQARHTDGLEYGGDAIEETDMECIWKGSL